MGGEMDEIDQGIIMRLEGDARTAFSDIAKELGTSVDTVRNRYRRLQNLGIVRGSTVVIQPEAAGYEVVVFFGISARPSHKAELLEGLVKIPSIILAGSVVGPHDVVAIGAAKGFEHLDRMVRAIRAIPSVVGVETTICRGPMELYPPYFLI